MDKIIWCPVVEQGCKPKKINEKAVACAAYLQVERKTQVQKIGRRKLLCELSPNTIPVATWPVREHQNFKQTTESIASHLDYITIIGRKRAGTP